MAQQPASNAIDGGLPAASDKIPVGLSTCLSGQPVRFNGSHSRSKLCLDTLAQYFDFKTFCPEQAAGFGTPRPAMRLSADPVNPRLIFSDSSKGQQDLTEQLQRGFQNELRFAERLDGYILMKNSPSCGLERVKVYRDNGYPFTEKSPGLFTKALQERYPLLPLEEEGRLHDAALCENFILRVYAHANFRNEVLAQPSYGKLVAFHSSYKFVLMAHSQASYQSLGRFLATAHEQPLQTTLDEYFPQLMAALAKPAKRKGHTNTMLHLLGFLKNSVDGTSRQHIVETIHKYREGGIPLITPITLLRHYIDQKGSAYVQAQRYWQPYPESLGLRNRL